MRFSKRRPLALVGLYRILIVVALSLHTLISYCQTPDDLFDPADTLNAIDLKEVPLLIEVLRTAGLSVQDAGMKKQFNEEFGALQQTVESNLSDPALGCLLKVRMFVNPEGAVGIPGGQLITYEGIGKSPVDGSATVRMKGTIGAPDSLDPPFENQSYYIWIKREKGVLKAGIIPRELRNSFDKDVDKEIKRRNDLNTVNDAQKVTGADTVTRDKDWSDLVESTITTMKDQAKQAELRSLVRRFSDAQKGFNEAYQEFVQDKRELQKQEFLQTTLHLASFVLSAIQSNSMKSLDGKSVSATSSGDHDAGQITIQSHEKQINLLTGEMRDLNTTIDLRGVNLRHLNEQLVNAFQKDGVEVPDSLKHITLPPKP